MKIVRFNRLNLKKPSYGILEEDNIYELKGSILNIPKPGKFLCKSSEINLIDPFLNHNEETYFVQSFYYALSFRFDACKVKIKFNDTSMYASKAYLVE